jgi:hypothetical protein
MIQWITRAIAIDTFEIDNQRDRTSTSLVDMMSVFSQSLNFLKSLQWEDLSIEVFIGTFLSLCVSTIKLYTEELTCRMLSYFPVSLIRRVDGDSRLLVPFLSEMRKFGNSQVTPAQIFVMINNFMHLRSAWIDYLDSVRRFFPTFGISEDMTNPVPQVGQISKRIPILFACLTAEQTTETIGPNVWVNNSRVKKLLVRKASEHILNPLFEQRGSDLFINLFDTTVADLNAKIDALESAISRANIRMMMQGFLHGLDTGLMNVLMYLGNAEPIKHGRLVTLLQFFEDVLNDVKNHIEALGLEEFNDATFKDFTPLCHYMLSHLETDPKTMIDDDPREANITLAMCNYLLIASATENSSAVKWTKENRGRYAKRTFDMSFNPRLY